MFRTEVTIVNKSGLHARPASEFVKRAAKFKSSIIIINNSDQEFNAKSIISVLSAGIKQNDRIVLAAEGEDEKQAVQELGCFIINCE